MIITPYTINTDNLIVIEYKRPTLLLDDLQTFNYWKQFHNIIKTSQIKILVNNFFWYIDNIIENKCTSYIGSGFKYNFWVKSQSDKDTLVKLLDNINN